MTSASIQSFGLTHTGTVRKDNEDAYVVMPEFGLFGVADGMGGVAGGAFASNNAINAVIQSAKLFEESSSLNVRISRIREKIDQSNREIRSWAELQGVDGTGTTVILLTFDPNRPEFAALLHAGDSRAYLLRGGRLKQLTRDHSVAESFGDGSEASVPAAFRNVITNAIGMSSDVKLDETLVSLQGGDTVLLCSDGLYRMVKDEEIRTILAAPLALEERAAALIKSANDHGGKDNSTIVLVQLLHSAGDTTDGSSEQETHDTDMKSAMEASVETNKTNRTETDDSVIEGRSIITDEIPSPVIRPPAQVVTTLPARGGKLNIFLAIGIISALILIVYLFRYTSARNSSSPDVQSVAAQNIESAVPSVTTVVVSVVSVEVLIQRAMVTGDWSFPIERLAEIDQDDSAAVKTETARAWMEEWRRANTNPTNAWADLNEFHAEVERTVNIWSAGFTLPEIAPRPGDSTEAARLYCYDRMRMQDQLFIEMDDYVSEVAQVISAFGKDPTLVESGLRSASATRESEPPQLDIHLKNMRSLLRSLNRWNGRSRNLPVGVAETKSIASTFIQPLEADVRELLSETTVYLSSIPDNDSLEDTRPALRTFYKKKNEYLKSFNDNALLINSDREKLAQLLHAMINSPGLQDLAASSKLKEAPSL